MPTCSFCKKHYKEPRGLTVFTFDGRAVHYCSGKCRKNTLLKRDPKKTAWVKKDKEARAVLQEIAKEEAKAEVKTG
jgi:large subunit ribosomal protein L24e